MLTYYFEIKTSTTNSLIQNVDICGVLRWKLTGRFPVQGVLLEKVDVH